MSDCLFLYCNSDTKEIESVRHYAITTDQRGDRIEITIDSAHPAFADPDRVAHYKLNDTNNGIESSQLPTNGEWADICKAGGDAALEAIGFTGDCGKCCLVAQYIQTGLSGCDTDAEKIQLIAKLLEYTLYQQQIIKINIGSASL